MSRNLQNPLKILSVTDNMAYVPIPKDLTEVKNKVLFGMTRRQLICFIPAAGIGIGNTSDKRPCRRRPGPAAPAGMRIASVPVRYLSKERQAIGKDTVGRHPRQVPVSPRPALPVA